MALETKFNDCPISISWQGRTFTPRNSDNRFRGEVELIYAFANSINTVALQVIQMLGIDSFALYLRQCGIECPLPNSPLLALGPIRLNGFQLLSTLTPILHEGHLCNLSRTGGMELSSDRVIYSYAVEMLKELLKATGKIGTGRYLGKNFPANLGGKTGTSDNCRDFWFMGAIDEDMYGLIWIGKGDESRIETRDSHPASASRFAVPIWGDLLSCFS
jgi:membrane carboxypeptidase/penicillin-binding protein